MFVLSQDEICGGSASWPADVPVACRQIWGPRVPGDFIVRGKLGITPKRGDGAAKCTTRPNGEDAALEYRIVVNI